MILFQESLLQLITDLNTYPGAKIIVGDFNDNLFTSKSLLKLIEQHQYRQLVTFPTTDANTLIDHVYIKNAQYQINVELVPTYYSHHNVVFISIA